MPLQNSLIPKLTREDIAAIFGPNMRAVRAYEALQNGLSDDVIDAINEAQADADAAQASADAAQADATQGIADAAAAQADATQGIADAAAAQADATQGIADAAAVAGDVATLSALQFVVLSADAATANERVLTAGANISIVDAGAGLAVTVDVAQNPAFVDGQGNTAIQIGDDGTDPEIGLYGAAPVLQPTTAIAGASFTANAGTAVNDASTFDGYTIGQIVAALRALGALA